MRQAVELSPKNPEYLMRLGLILTMQERPKVAAIFFERALKLDPENLILRRHLAGSQWQGAALIPPRKTSNSYSKPIQVTRRHFSCWAWY